MVVVALMEVVLMLVVLLVVRLPYQLVCSGVKLCAVVRKRGTAL